MLGKVKKFYLQIHEVIKFLSGFLDIIELKKNKFV